jgi:predicted secreted protein
VLGFLGFFLTSLTACYKFTGVNPGLSVGDFLMRLMISLIAASALLLSAGTVFSQTIPTPQPAQRVSLSASASVQMSQDVLTLSLTTQRDGVDAQTVQSQVKAALDTALTLAKRDAKTGLMEVSTGRFAMSPRYDRNGKLNGWHGTAELILHGSDFARMGETAGKLSTLTVANASFELTPQQRQSAQALAQSQAIAQFRQRASEIAVAFGFKNYSLLEAQLSYDDQGGGRPMLAMARAMSADAPVPIEAGSTSVTVTVSGSVQLN